MTVRVFSGDIPAALVDKIAHSDEVGIDTETSGLDWRVDRLELVQLYTEAEEPVLLRPSAEGFGTGLATILAAEHCAKIFHFAPFDLRFLIAATELMPVNVRCTKSASKLVQPARPHDAHSLASLVSERLGVNLPKGAVRTSDWSARELSAEQVAYAANDVAYLPRLWALLDADLRRADLTSVYDAICGYMPVDAWLEVHGVPDPLRY